MNENPVTPSFEKQVLSNLKALDKRFDKVDTRLDKLESCIHGIEERMTDTLQGFAKDFSNQLQEVKTDVDLLKTNSVQVKNDTEIIASAFGFIRDDSGNLVRPV